MTRSTVRPVTGSLPLTTIWPPSWSMIRLQMVSPKPVSLTATLEGVQLDPKDVLVVSSQEGVFYNRETSGNIFGQWLRLGNKLPRAVGRDLHYVPEEDLLIAGTLAWVLGLLAIVLLATSAVGTAAM